MTAIALDAVQSPSLNRAVFYPAFDYLRGIAAFGVFVAHADRYHYLPAQMGNACVQVFFALSGFLIGNILIRSTPSDLPRFFYNRAARIWIPYAIAIGILFAVTLLKQGMSDSKFAEFFFYKATFVYNWFGPSQLAEMSNRMPLSGTGNHFWSICVEEQFYLVAPFLLLYLNRALAVLTLAGLVALNFVVPHNFAAISLGVLLAMTSARWWSVCIAGFIAILLFNISMYDSWMPFVAVAIVGFAAQPGQKTTAGDIIGGASYSFYLNHWLGLFITSAAIKFGVTSVIAALLGACFAISLSVLHYLFIDRQIAARRQSYFTKTRGIALLSTAVGLVALGLIVGFTLKV